MYLKCIGPKSRHVHWSMGTMSEGAVWMKRHSDVEEFKDLWMPPIIFLWSGYIAAM